MDHLTLQVVLMLWVFDFNESLGSYLWSLIVSKLQAKFSNFKTEVALQCHIKKFGFLVSSMRSITGVYRVIFKEWLPNIVWYVKGLILFLAPCRISQIIVFWLFLVMAFHLKLILPLELIKFWFIAEVIHF